VQPKGEPRPANQEVELGPPMEFREADGCVTDSRLEHAVHSMLIGLNWSHDTHPPIPDGKGGKADFKVRASVWVEVWGREDLSTYKDRMERKQTFYRQAGYKLVEFLPEDLQNQSVGTLTRKVREIQDLVSTGQRKLAPEGPSKPQRILSLSEFDLGRTLALADDVTGPELDKLEDSLQKKATEIQEAESRTASLKKELVDLQSKYDGLLRPFRKNWTSS
jgi:hypothetical protein